MQSLLFQIAKKKFFQSRFINSDLPRLEFTNFIGININAANIISRFSKTSTGNQSYITGANNSNLHNFGLKLNALNKSYHFQPIERNSITKYCNSHIQWRKFIFVSF